MANDANPKEWTLRDAVALTIYAQLVTFDDEEDGQVDDQGEAANAYELADAFLAFREQVRPYGG